MVDGENVAMAGWSRNDRAKPITGDRWRPSRDRPIAHAYRGPGQGTWSDDGILPVFCPTGQRFFR